MNTAMTSDAEKLGSNLPEGWAGERHLRVSREEAQSWMDALEPHLTEEDRRQDAALVDGYERYWAKLQEAERVHAELRLSIPAWGTTLSLYQWARDTRDIFIDSRGTAIMREAIVHAIMNRIASE